MKRKSTYFLITLIFMTLTLLPILQFSHGAIGEERKLEACWPTYPPDKDALSDYLEVLRAYALPPAWEILNLGQEESPSHQTVSKWEARTGYYKVLN